MNLWPPRAPTEVRVTNDSAGGSGPTAGPGCFYDTSPNPPLVTYVTVRCPLAADGLLPGVKIRLGDGETEFATVDERLRASVMVVEAAITSVQVVISTEAKAMTASS